MRRARRYRGLAACSRRVLRRHACTPPKCRPEAQPYSGSLGRRVFGIKRALTEIRLDLILNLLKWFI